VAQDVALSRRKQGFESPRERQLVISMTHYGTPDVALSVQGQDANAAWRAVMFIVQNLNASVEVSFIWRNKEGAENPGKTGSMRLG
jgi:hypothetical protein